MSSSWWRNFWNRLFSDPGAGGGTPPPEAPPPVAGAGDSAPVRLRFGVVSIVGDFREHNEDNYYVPDAPPGRDARTGSTTVGTREAHPVVGRHNDSTLDLPTVPRPDGLFIVADGMGGQLAGEQASKMAVEIIPNQLLRRLGNGNGGTTAAVDDDAIVEAIRDSMAEANREILALSHVESEYSNMGTTAVVGLFRSGRVYVAGIGDSRAYRLRDGRLQQLTKDHSLADALVEAGTISREESENHKFKHVLYLYLGSKDARAGPEDIQVMDVRPGDRFLLATDGLTGVVKNEQIAELLAAGDDPQQAAQRLVDQAQQNQSKDNITCLVVHVS